MSMIRPHHFLSTDHLRMTKEQWRAQRMDRLAVALARSERKRVREALVR